MLKQSLLLHAEYNQWMNARLFKTVSKLDDQQISKDQGAFFGSIIGTLNHLMVGDLIWLRRFSTTSGGEILAQQLSLYPVPKGLNDTLYHELAHFSDQRNLLDQQIISWLELLPEQVLAQPLQYKNTKGESSRRSLALLIQHLFNHQTHHRGQITTLLSQQGVDMGATDLLMLIAEDD